MSNGVRTPDLPSENLLDDVLGHRDGTTTRQSLANLATQLAGSGAVAARLDEIEAQVTSGQIAVSSWSALSVITTTQDGTGAEVLGSDTGTHAQATATGYDGASVNNAGRYSWAATWSRWLRIGDTGLANVAPADHGHPIADVAGLQVALDNKSASDHSHTTADIVGLDAALGARTAHPTGRPGETPDLYAGDLTGVAGAPAAPGVAVATSVGQICRVTGAEVLALRQRVPLPPEVAQTVTWAVCRAVNPSDPSGDTVRMGVQWLDNTGAALSQLTDATLDKNLTVPMGRWRREVVIAAENAPGVDFVWPDAAVYAVPFVQTYGATGETDIEQVEIRPTAASGTGGVVHLTAAGAANAITATAGRSWSSDARAENFRLPVTTANTGPVTLAVDGGDPAALLLASGEALQAGYLVSGATYDLIWDGSAWRLTTGASAAAIEAEATAQAVAAAASATSSQASSAAASSASGRLDVGSFASLQTTFVYTSPGAGQQAVAAGDIIRLVDGGHLYRVAASDATDHHLTTTSGANLYVLSGAQGYDVQAFGADPDAADAYTAFRAWMDVLETRGGEYYVPPGHYTLTNKVVGDVTAAHARVTFARGARVTSSGAVNRVLAFNSVYETGLALGADITRGDITATLTDATSVNVGDLIYIQSTVIAETAFNNPAREINLVADVSGNVVTFEKPFVFDYATHQLGGLFNYRNRRVDLHGLDIIGTAARGVALSGFQNPVVTDFTYEQANRPSQDNGEDAIYSQRNWKPVFKHLSFRYARYGLTDNTSYGVVVDGVDAYDCRHPVDPNALSIGTCVLNMTARNCLSAINAHAALDVVYDGFDIIADRGRPLMRGTGGALRNGVAEYITPDLAGEHCILPWAAGFEYMLDRRFEIISVRETFPNTTSGVLTVSVKKVKRVYCRDYHTVGISVGDHDGVDEFSAVNCQWAFTRGGARIKTTLIDTWFDTSQTPATPTIAWTTNGVTTAGINPAITMRGGGTRGDFTQFINGDGAAHAIPTGASGAGGTATLTFAAMTAAFPVGSKVRVGGVMPVGYDGLYTVTASTTTSVSFKCSEAGAFVSAGRVEAANPRLFDGCDLRAGSISYVGAGPLLTYRMVNCTVDGSITNTLISAADLAANNDVMGA